MRTKTTEWIFQATNERNLKGENRTSLRKENHQRETESLLIAA